MLTPQLLLAITLVVLSAGRGEARLHVTAKSAKAFVRGPQGLHTKPKGASKGPSGGTTQQPWLPGTRVFPSLTSCSQRPDSTPFRVSPNVTKAAPGATWCFSIHTATPQNSNAPCGLATSLERVQLWAAHANRSSITSMSVRTDVSERTLYGSWANKGSRDDPFRDELVFSKLGWTEADVEAVRPRICLTLRGGTSLDAICQGPQGRCIIGLYSTGDKGAKCCPVYMLLAA